MAWHPDRYDQLRRLLGLTSVDAEIDEEMVHHFEGLVRQYRDEGLSEEGALARARERFGDFDRYRSEATAIARDTRRDEARREWIRDTLGDVAVAVRSLRRRPGFSLAVLLTLTVSMAAIAVTVTLVDRFLVRPLPYADADRLVVVRHPVPGLRQGQEWNLSQAGFFYFRDQAQSLDELGVWSGRNVNLAGEEGAERAVGSYVSASLLDVLGARPLQGRLLVEDDNRPEATPVIVLSHGVWRQRFGSDPNVVGSSLSVNSVPHEIVGVLAPGLEHPFLPSDVWLPLELDRAAPAANSHWMASVGRLAPGTDLDTAQRELEALASRLPELFPTAYTPGFVDRYQFGVRAHPLRNTVVGDVERTLWILLGSAFLLLAVAVSNVAGLFLVRAEARNSEMAIRASLGASAGRLAWVRLAEVLVLVSASVAIALGIAWLALRALPGLEIEALPELVSPRLSATAAGLVVMLALAVALLVAALTRIAPRATTASLRSGGLRGTSRSSRLLRESMIVAQVAVALVMTTGAGLLMRSAYNLTRIDPGVSVEQSWLVDLALPAVRYRGFEDVRVFHQTLASRIEALPGVERVGFTTLPPFSGIDGCSLVFVENYAIGPDERPPCVATALVAPGTFDALGVPVTGRAPEWSDVGGPALVVSRAFAERFWPGDNPIGKGVRGNGGEPPFYRVVGVAADIRADGLDRPPSEAVYFPMVPMEGANLWAPPRGATLVVSSSLGADVLAGLLRREVAALDPEVPVANIRSVGAVVANSTRRLTLATGLVVGAAGLAVFLAAVGLYGLLAYLVGNRRTEIGVRMALGARRPTVVRMVVGRALAFTGIGVVIGLLVSLALSRSLDAMLFEVEPSDPAIMVAAVLALGTIAVLASVGPARRAAAVSPVTALRSD